ncbi:MAG: GNAT family N-acetyltransferase, partial [Patescibacteria group bacterium]|nr:GNAT family N-acetyltransferase [Patescibacteria group bacterium]
KKGREVVVRYPKKEDLDILLEFINKLSKENTYITFSGEEVTREEEEKYLEKVLKELEDGNGATLLGFVDDKLVASAGVTRGGKRREHLGTVGITIHKDFRNEGIGKEILRLLFEEAKILGLKMVDLKAYSPNCIAINLYKKLGFEEVGKGPGTIRHNDNFVDEVWMIKKL